MPVLSNIMNGIANLPAAVGFGGGSPVAGAEGDIASAVGNAIDNAQYEFREFYASACPHCKHLTPVWESASKTHASETSGNVKWTAVQCADERWEPVADNEEACKHVMGFPTMKMFKDGKEIAEYEGARNERALINWVNDQAGIKSASMPLDLGLLLNGQNMFSANNMYKGEEEVKKSSSPRDFL